MTNEEPNKNVAFFNKCRKMKLLNCIHIYIIPKKYEMATKIEKNMLLR